jgi:hypothetical protein
LDSNLFLFGGSGELQVFQDRSRIKEKTLEVGYLKAANHNAAEKKAQKKYSEVKATEVSVAYTEL